MQPPAQLTAQKDGCFTQNQISLIACSLGALPNQQFYSRYPTTTLPPQPRSAARSKMTRNNQLYIDNDDGTGVCLACDRNFNTVNGALNHCRNAQTHEGEWCERCEWLFVSEAAHQTHVNASSRHNACETCDLDFNTHQELVTHDTEIHYYCSPCVKFFNNHRELDNHDVDFHCMCRDCGEFFINRNNLNQV